MAAASVRLSEVGWPADQAARAASSGEDIPLAAASSMIRARLRVRYGIALPSTTKRSRVSPAIIPASAARANVDHRLGEKHKARLGRPMGDRNLVVILECIVIRSEAAVTVRLEDTPDPAHAERVQLGGAQRAHAGCAEHMDALCHRPQDLAVPDRSRLMEIAIHDPDHRGLVELDRAVYVALPCGRQDHCIDEPACLGGRHGRSQKYDRAGCHGGPPPRIISARMSSALRSACARWPGWASA